MTRLSIVGACSILQFGCSSLSDPAVRLASCVGKALENETQDRTVMRTTCDIEMRGNSVIVLHPVGALRDEELVSAGLPRALLAELRVIRLGTNAGIYVIATDPGVTGTGTDRSILSSWTTSQMRLVEIDKVIVLPTALHQPVGIDIGGSSARRVIEAIY